MKLHKILFLLVASVLGLTSCSTDDCGNLGYSGTEYTWEKKDYVFMVPVDVDSVQGDSVYVELTFDSRINPQIIYSSVLDSFRITTDIRGSYFREQGKDSIWAPRYSYSYSSELAWLHLRYHFYENTTKKNSQNPQCSPVIDRVEITKLRIEMPKTVKYIFLRGY